MSPPSLANSAPSEWLPGLEALRALPDGGTALLVGATDRGKTTFAALAARTLSGEGMRVAVIDADIGQSEIGPPGTVGAAWATPDADRLHDLKPAAQFFVGAYSPPSVALELIVALTKAVRWARTNGAQRILIDTSGFVSGPTARDLKSAKAQTAAPHLLLGFERGDEITPLLSAMQAASGAPFLALQTPAGVIRKPTALRTTRRLTRLSRALEGSRLLALPLTEITTVGTVLSSGEVLTPELVRWAGTALRLPIAYAERTERVLTVFLSAATARSGWEQDAGPVTQYFGCQMVRTIALPAYCGVLLGLGDENGKMLTVGRCDSLDMQRGEMVVSAPPPASVERVRLVQFGRVRVGSDGSPQGNISPGEI